MDNLTVKDGIVQIPMSTGFYYKLVQLANYLFEQNSNGIELEAFLKLLSENEKEEWIEHYITVITVIKAFIEKAKEAELIVENQDLKK